MNGQPSVLIVEDDAALAALIGEFLAGHGFAVAVEGRGDAAVARVRAEAPDAVLLDVMLPGDNGFSVCRALRPAYRGVIVMLTARGDEVDEVVGLEMGADDYITKPVRPRVLLARLQALLRRSQAAVPAEGPVVGEAPRAPRFTTSGGLVIDPASRSVWADGRPVPLTTAEYDLLWALASRAGEVVERDELFLALRGFAWDGIDRSIDLRVSRLRRKLGDGGEVPRVLRSVRGTGYLLIP